MVPEDGAGRVRRVDDHEAVEDIVDVRVGADRVPVRPESLVVAAVGRGRRCRVARTVDARHEVVGVARPTHNEPVANGPFDSRSVDSVDLVAITYKPVFLKYACILSVLGELTGPLEFLPGADLLPHPRVEPSLDECAGVGLGVYYELEEGSAEGGTSLGAGPEDGRRAGLAEGLGGGGGHYDDEEDK